MLRQPASLYFLSGLYRGRISLPVFWGAVCKLIVQTAADRKHLSRSHDAAIRVYDDACNVIETHEHAGEFKAP
jgi:hypothetical protein